MKRLLQTLCLALLVSCQTAEKPQVAQETPKANGGCMAVGENPKAEMTLDFTNPPEFVFTIELKDRDKVITYRSSDNDPLKFQEYRFEGKELVDRGENKGVIYKYKGSFRSSSKLMIWTDIKSMSPGNLRHMRVDRVPFCVVQMINPAGIQPVPLNREGAAESEKFQYIERK